MAVYKQEIDSSKGEPALIIAADTVVVSPLGEILEKPRSEKHHIAMLQGLRNSGVHKVYTAVVCMAPREDAVSPGYAIETQVEVSAQAYSTGMPATNSPCRKQQFALILQVSDRSYFRPRFFSNQS